MSNGKLNATKKKVSISRVNFFDQITRSLRAGGSAAVDKEFQVGTGQVKAPGSNGHSV